MFVFLKIKLLSSYCKYRIEIDKHLPERKPFTDFKYLLSLLGTRCFTYNLKLRQSM